MNNFQTRVLTALIFGVAVISAVIFSPYSFGALFLLITVLCLSEYDNLLYDDKKRTQGMTGILAGVYLFSSVFQYQMEFVSAKFLLSDLLILVFIFIFELYRKRQHPFENIAYTITGLAYIVVPLTAFMSLGFIKDQGYDFHVPLAVLIMLWSNDSGAYLVGVSMGKNKLMERISPKKTWEGFIGGVMMTLIAGWILSSFYTEWAMIHWLVIGGLIAVFSTLGDLVESMFKRSVHIKDSGGLLPGHGGLLDRFDGLFLSAPVVYIYIELFIL